MAWYRCGMNATYNATTVSRSGAICNYVANVGGVPLSRFIANITPIQEGSGDPSPINQRPITGRSAVNVARTGVNLWDEQWEQGTINDTTGIPSSSGSTTQIRSKNFCACKGDTNYYVYVGSNQSIRVFWYDSTQTFISQTPSTKNVVITSPNNAQYFKIRSTNSYGNTYLNDISINYPATDTAYHAYTGQTATINLGGTYYGGTLNVGTGLLTVTHVNIASYNGESINEPWLCSEAPYIPNTTPPTGSQVVYPLTTPQTYQLTPAQITQLLGENNVWADSGDSEVDFFKIIRT